MLNADRSRRSRPYGALRVARAWVTTMRPINLVSEAVPLLVGTGLAVRVAPFSPLRFSILAAIGISIQAAVRYLNDPFDYKRGIDRPGQLKPYHAVSQGLDVDTVQRVGLVCLAIAVGLCVWISLLVDVRLLLVAAVIAVCAFAYAGGPWPYSSRAFGELAEFLWFGLFGTVLAMYCQANRVVADAFVCGAAIGLLSTTFQLANNTRDMGTDRAARKVTIPQLIGRRWTNVLFVLLLAFAYVLLVTLAVLERNVYVLLPVFTLPLALAAGRRFLSARDVPDYSPLYPRLRYLELCYGVLLLAGLLLSPGLKA